MERKPIRIGTNENWNKENEKCEEEPMTSRAQKTIESAASINKGRQWGRHHLRLQTHANKLKKDEREGSDIINGLNPVRISLFENHHTPPPSPERLEYYNYYFYYILSLIIVIRQYYEEITVSLLWQVHIQHYEIEELTNQKRGRGSFFIDKHITQVQEKN